MADKTLSLLWDATRLRLLVEVERRGSVSAAAKAVGIGQSSASEHLRLLETAAGQRLVERNGRGSRLTEAGHVLADKAIVPDDIQAITVQVQAWAEDRGVDVIISTGGTGFAPRDVTPEAVRPLCRREMDGFAVLFHRASFGTVGLSTLQSRAFAGQIADTFIFCLPGSTGACRDGWDLVLKLELDSRYRPCSLAGQVPRLRDLCA